MQVIINGKKAEMPEQISLQKIMEERKMTGGKAVAELNEEIIEQSVWSKTILKDNDNLEIVTFMGGGSK